MDHDNENYQDYVTNDEDLEELPLTEVDLDRILECPFIKID